MAMGCCLSRELTVPDIYDEIVMPSSMKWWPLQNLPSNFGALGIFSGSMPNDCYVTSDLYLLTTLLDDPVEMLSDSRKPR